MQATAAAPQATPIETIDFDLSRVGTEAAPFSTRRRCRPSDDAIVICARRPEGGDYPLTDWERAFALRPIRAETRLFGEMTGAVNLEQVELLRGEISNRIVVRLRLPF